MTRNRVEAPQGVCVCVCVCKDAVRTSLLHSTSTATKKYSPIDSKYCQNLQANHQSPFAKPVIGWQSLNSLTSPQRSLLLSFLPTAS